jgi:hypothetical protein
MDVEPAHQFTSVGFDSLDAQIQLSGNHFG